MFQNHMLQLLALTAMEPPSAFESEPVQDEKVKVYRSMRPFPVGNLQAALVLGQYGCGVIDGQSVPAYREEPGVDSDSMIPTFGLMKIMIDNWRWQGVPFYMTSGKRLPDKVTEIAVQFKHVPHSMFRRTLGEDIIANRLTLGIYPEERITLTFQTKSPGTRVQLRSVTMDFNYYPDQNQAVLDAYEKVLIDCMMGDRMLFWRQDAVEICWSFLTPILENCEVCDDRAARLYFYPAGSPGPREIERLFRQD
jgi:glucose-6-phosphate 1-dehydrogenase